MTKSLGFVLHNRMTNAIMKQRMTDNTDPGDN